MLDGMTPDEKRSRERETRRLWRERNPERYAATVKRNSDKRRGRINADPVLKALEMERVRVLGRQPRLDLIAYLGGCCVVCGYTDVRGLQIDHVRNNGNEERRVVVNYYGNMLANLHTGDYQVLCANCNSVKRHENRTPPPSGKRQQQLRAVTDPKKIAKRARGRAAYEKEYQSADLREARRLKGLENRAKARQEVLHVLGGCCVQCGANDPRALHVDHVNGDGHIHRRRFSCAYSVYRDITKNAHTGAYQLLCANCNTVKRLVNNETTIKYRKLAQECTPAAAPPSDKPPRKTSWTPERRARMALAREQRTEAVTAALAAARAALAASTEPSNDPT